MMLLCVLQFCTSTQWMQRQTTSHQADESLKNKRGKAFQWLGGRGLHTTRSIAQMFLGVVFDASSHPYRPRMF